MYGKDRSGVGRQILTDDNGVLLRPAGKYADAALNGRLFGVANQAAVATTAALATTWTGLGRAWNKYKVKGEDHHVTRGEIQQENDSRKL